MRNKFVIKLVTKLLLSCSIPNVIDYCQQGTKAKYLRKIYYYDWIIDSKASHL